MHQDLDKRIKERKREREREGERKTLLVKAKQDEAKQSKARQTE